MANICEKFGILLWKSYIIRTFHWIVTFLELFVPILLFIGVAILNKHATNRRYSEPEHIYKVQSEEDIKLSFRRTFTDKHVLYTPVNNFTNNLMQMVKTDSWFNFNHVHGVPKESDIEGYFKQSHQNDSESVFGIFGIVFLGDVNNASPKFLNYKIRSIGTPYSHARTNLFVDIFDSATPELYERNGFLGLQIVLNRCFMKLIGIVNDPIFSVQKFPTPAMKDNAANLHYKLLQITTVLGFLFLCPGVLKRVVEEKQTGVKELMKLMGLPSLLLWISWFLHAMSVTVLSITVITIIIGIPFNGSDPVLRCSGSVVWMFLFLYCVASVSFLFAVSAIFKKPTFALVCGLLLWIGTGVGSMFIVGGHTTMICKILSFLLPNFTLVWGFHAINAYETRELSMSFGDVLSPSIAMGGDYQMNDVWLIFFGQTVVYFLLTLYLEAVLPGDYGVPKPWYFPFLICYKWMQVAPMPDLKGGFSNDPETFEPLAETLPVGIKIRNLRKVYKSPWKQITKVAVDDVSLDICKEQITALLGHNGAGKSTTMMILTGMISPTSGTVEINGYNIKHHMSKIRESLGLCPQHNLLFPDLTVQQHLKFFAKLKGSPDHDPDSEVSLYAKRLNLTSHLNKTPAQLSGGYKRRLCLALAFIGRSKTIVLDEPTSGLDPEARREIWDLLLSMRGSRTILITTHIMEEADVLGDRIAIMDHGQVQCYGTPMYLKKIYGTGYTISILKKSSSDGETIEAAVKSVIAGAELKSSVASLMTFCLPDEKRNSFPELFSLLNRERVPLGIDSIGVSITTLEEVFLRVGEIALEEAGKNEDMTSETSEKSEGSIQPLSPGNLKGVKLWLQQVVALLEKRCLVMNYNYVILLVLMVLVIILVTVVSLHPFGGNPVPPLPMHLSLYGSTKVLYTSDPSTPEKLVVSYKEIVNRAKSQAELLSPGTNVTMALLKKAYEDRESYVFEYVVAAELKGRDHYMAHYSDLALHSLPISVNLLTNSLIKNEKSDEYGISVVNHPFNLYEAEYLDDYVVAFIWVSLVPIALTFWVGLFTILPMEERVSSSRQLQSMAGVSVWTYWFSLYIFDLVIHLLLCLVLIFTVYLCDRNGVFSDGSEMSALFIILLLYGVSAIPVSYFVSFWSDTWAGCSCVLVMFNIAAGIIMMGIMEYSRIYDIVQVLEGVFRLIPNYAFTQIIYNFVSQVMDEKNCVRMSLSELQQKCSTSVSFVPDSFKICCYCLNNQCDTTPKSYLKENQTLLLYLGFAWLLYMGLVFILDISILEWLWEKIKSSRESCESSSCTGNDDVDGEAESVEEIFKKDVCTTGSADLLVYNLKKKYGISPKPLAVKGVSFHVKPGECFGLLGVNGAGKTTTFKMLTGAIQPTHGVAAIAGYRSDQHKSQYLSQIGYCPQHDALIECMTATQKLKFYGALRGVPKERLNREVQQWINMMGLREYKNKSCGTYSGGNKRKLMAAVALIGSPPLVFLDEPTSGVDPVARRNLWNSLISLQKAGQSIVLTSHSMEECEALCNRLGIMVGGQLMCMGNIPYLKTKYKQGSTIKLKLKAGSGEESIQKVKEQIQRSFSRATLKDAHETLLHYQVSDPGISWGTMFKTMETLKEDSEVIEDYTISETTLEEVFLSFAQT